MPIDDFTPVSSSLEVSGISDPITNISVRLIDLFHTFFGNLAVDLTLPTGTSVSLFSRVLSSTDANGDIIFDDLQSLQIQNFSGAQVTGTFATESGLALREALFLLEGTPVSGDYGTLYIMPNGQYLYKTDPSNSDLLGLQSSQQSVQEVFTYTLQDPGGLTDTASLTIDIFGPEVSEFIG